MKRVSVIIPTYNRATYVKQLLNQLLGQNVPPDEIIIVDDHSSDQTQGIVTKIAEHSARVQYVKNKGRYQRDAKVTGLQLAHGEYIGFLDDDVYIDDSAFFQKLQLHLAPDTVVQAKVILEQMGQKNLPGEVWLDRFATRPYPILESLTTHLNAGSTPRSIFPLIEFGNFWPATLKRHFIDPNLILDGYGESYAWSIKLHHHRVHLLMVPDLIIRHPGAATGGSKRFDKRSMLRGFTQFHYGYFTNMIYLHARYFSAWVWLWLPFYVTKACLALLVNRDAKGFYRQAILPMTQALQKFFIRRSYV